MKKNFIGMGLLVAAGFAMVLGSAATSLSGDKVISRNEQWEEKYPHQYKSWRMTSENDEIEDLIKKKPQLAILWAGYGFAKDYNAPRGHFYGLQSNINSLRTGAPVSPVTGPMPTACWSCKSPDVPRIVAEENELEYFTGKWAKYGDEMVNPIGCANCHDSETGEPAISSAYLVRGLESAGLKSKDFTGEDMRNLGCAQCHSEYYFKVNEWTDKEGNKKVAKVVTFPWGKGLSAENMEEYYDEIGFKDWTHKISKAPMLKAQHPGYEIFQSGIHAKSGVTCADCHMPQITEGDVTYSSHHLVSPLDEIENICIDCHDQDAEDLKAVVERKFERKEQLMEIAMNSLAKAHLEAGKAWEAGATEEEMEEILTDIRHAQWRWDYSIASHGSYFHAPEETLHLLALANETAQDARFKIVKVLAKHGAADFVVPDFSTKEKAQALAGVDLKKLVADKVEFKNTLLKEWTASAIKNGKLDSEARKGMSDKTSYSK